MARDESGVIAVMFAIMLPMFLLFAALAIDMSYAYKVRNTTQVAASAAALAGVSQLNDVNSNGNPNDDGSVGYRQEAVEYAYRNMTNDGAIINSTCGTFNTTTDLANPDGVECDDVKAGHWDSDKFYAWDNTADNGCTTDCYDPEIMDLNSIQVITRRAEANNNPLQLFFAGTAGLAQTDINTTAVATTSGGVISNGCLIALNNEAGSDQTFHLNGDASVITVGCDIRVDQCCSYPGGCQQGALRANGTPEIIVTAVACNKDDSLCSANPGIIDVCGTVLSQGPVDLDPTPQCNPNAGDGPNFINCPKDPSEESHDPLSDLAKDNVEWSDLADSMCEYYDFDITKLDNPSYEYYSPDDVTTIVDPDTGAITKTYTLYPGTYCGDGSKNADAINFSGGGSSPNIVFADGIYVVKNGKIDLAGSGNIFCDACGFFLTGDPATLDWTGSNNINMTAINDPDNPMHGLLVVQDPFPPTTEDQEIKIAGSNDGSYYGGFYLPNADVKIVGTVGSVTNEGEDGCLYIIADELEFSGTSGLQANNTCGLFGGTDFTASPLFFTLAH